MLRCSLALVPSLIFRLSEKEFIMRSCLFAVAVLLVANPVADIMAADPLSWLPSDVNAVARVNVAEIYQSEIARKEGWIRKATESFVQQESFIPPGTKQIVVGAELDLSDNMMARRKYSVLVPEDSMTLEKLSPWFASGIDTISGKKLAQFGNDGFIVDAGDGCWLTSVSSSRQFISRWLRNGPTSGGNQLSPYLRSALKGADKSPQLILAIDLQDNFSASEILEQLQSADWFNSKDGAKNAADVIESVRGITIVISIGADRTGTATLEFGKDAAPLKPILDKLVPEVLDRVGVAADKLQEWKWTVKGNQITGGGSVSPGTGREVLAILDPPSITHAMSANSTSDSTNPDEVIAKTSLKYCKSIQVLLSDLRGTLNREKNNHAVLFERYGRRIDDLPKLNVDSQLLDFGTRVSSSLRYQGQAERMNKINAGTSKRRTFAAASMQGNFGNVGPFDNVGWNPISPSDAPGVLDAQANERSKEVRFSEWKHIEDGLVAVRRAMTEKYKLEF